MVFDSNQINQMIGGQQAMFANHAAFAHNVGAQMGFGGTPQGLQAPSFGGGPGGMGSAAVGMMGQAIPGAAAGLSIAGGLGFLGKAGGYLDPFTGVGRAFVGGAAASGGGTLGAMGGGLAAAAGPAALYYGAYKGISHLGSQIYQGAQNISQVGGMVGQYMPSQFGEPGARMGGQMSRSGIQNITSALHEIAGEQTSSSMRDLMQVMDRAGQAGMLSGMQSPEQFKQKFRTIVDKAKTIASVLDMTLQEGTSVLGNFNSMGLWSTQDILGASLTAKQLGPGRVPGMMQTMGQGAARSHAMGGSMAAGAHLAQNQLLNVSAALGTGALSNEMIQEFTGGVGGARGQEMLANRLTGAMQSMTQTPMGRLSMAGLGEVVDGKFTGRIDQKKLAAFQRGEISVDQLQSMGQKGASTREGAASFTYRQEQIGQELMAQGGMELVGSMFQSALEKAGFGGADEDIQGLMLQKMYGLKRRDAQMMQRILKKLPEIQDKRSRKELAVIREAAMEAERRQSRSYEAFKNALSNVWETEVDSPIQEFGERLATGLSEGWDELQNEVLGRTRQVNMSRQDRMRRLLTSTSRPGDLQGITTNYLNSATGSQFSSNAAIRMNNAGSAGALDAFTSVFGTNRGTGTRADVLVKSGARTQRATGATGEIEYQDFWGEGAIAVSADEARRVSEGVRFRGSNAKLKGAFKDQQGTQSAMQRVKSAYSKLMLGDIRRRKRLNDARKNSTPQDYARLVKEELKAIGGEELMADFAYLNENSVRGSDTIDDTIMNAIAVVQDDSSYEGTGLDVDFKGVSSALGTDILTTGEEFSKEITSRSDNMLKMLKGAALTRKSGSLQEVMGTRPMDITTQQLRTQLTERGSISDELMSFLKSGSTSIEAFPELSRALGKEKGKGPLTEIVETVSKMTDKERGEFAKFAQEKGDVSQLLEGMVYAETVTERGRGAETELAALGAKGGPRELRDVLSTLAGAGKTGDLEEYALAKDRARSYAQSLTGKGGAETIRRLRKTGGAVAEHIADMAEIERLDAGSLVGMGQRDLQATLRKKGLEDEVALGREALPEKERKQLEAVLESKKITKKQADYLKETLRKIEERAGLEDSRKSRDQEQVRLNNSMRAFVGANEAFVLAVKTALPGLKDVEAAQITAEARRVSQNSATAETPGGV